MAEVLSQVLSVCAVRALVRRSAPSENYLLYACGGLSC